MVLMKLNQLFQMLPDILLSDDYLIIFNVNSI